MGTEAEEILSFWLDEVGPAGWYQPNEALDQTIRDRFGALWSKARVRTSHPWTCAPRSSLALVILLDQFPRNMFRGNALAFASDHRALLVAKSAIARRQDQELAMPGRHFFYLPFMHSEVTSEQHRGVRLFTMCPGGEEYLKHARAHRWVIRRFGRFPYRNEALGRQNTSEEETFLQAGGYGAALAAVAAPSENAVEAAGPSQ